MSARSSMTHRAELEQNTAIGTDEYNNPLPPNWEALDVIPCRAYTKVRRETIDGKKSVLIEDLKALFSINADVSEDYRIANITDRQNKILFSGPIDIVTIQRRSNNLEASLDRIQS